jgi:hypothetical protein
VVLEAVGQEELGRRLGAGFAEEEEAVGGDRLVEGAPSSFHFGSSSVMARGSMIAPERMCAPGSEPFSSTTTETSCERSWASCFRRIAVARPAGPAPTTTTSYSIASRGPYCARIASGVIGFLLATLVVDSTERLSPMSYSIDLSGRVALVTGASSGLGAQFARILAKRVPASRSPEGGWSA